MSERWVRADGVLWRRVAHGVMVLPPETDEPFLLLGSGALLWELLETDVATEEAAVSLARAFGVTPELASADIRPCLLDLTERGAVRAA